MQFPHHCWLTAVYEGSGCAEQRVQQASIATAQHSLSHRILLHQTKGSDNSSKCIIHIAGEEHLVGSTQASDKHDTALKTSCWFQRPKTILCLKGKAEEGTVVLLLPVLVIQVLKNCYVNWVVLPFPDKSALRRRLSLLHQYQHAIFLILGSSPDTAIDLPSQSMHSWNNYDTTQNIIFKESLPSSPQCKAEGHCFPYMSKLTDFWRRN